MGEFGYLSKAHLDQGVPTGDVAAKLSLIEEKIHTQRDNIKLSREALAQMDNQVNNVMNKGDTEKSAERSVQIRRQQAAERAKIQKEIETANSAIGKLNEERAPVASQLRKVEAEVGPIKYIAAMIYGDNPDQNILERAVRWVIILLVLVFDPLAIALILAANQSKEWDAEIIDEEQPKESAVPHPVTDDPGPIERTVYEPDDGPLTEEQVDQIKEEKSILELHPYLNTPVATFKNDVPIQVYQTEVEPSPETEPSPEILTNGVTTEIKSEYEELPGDYVIYRGKHMKKDVLMGMRPDLMLTVDSTRPVNTNFGTSFPAMAIKGDVFVRVDVLPNKVYKFDGSKWIISNKDQTTTYLQDPEYIKHLISKVDQGEYDVDLLTEHEKQQIEDYLRNQKI